MKTLEQHIEEVMDWFDFEKVHRVMTMLDWKWANTGGVPEIPDLRKRVRDLMRSLWNSEDVCHGTGGFMVRLYREENWTRFSVAFQVADWNSEDAE